MSTVQKMRSEDRTRILAIAIVIVLIAGGITWWLVSRAFATVRFEGEIEIGMENHWEETEDPGGCEGTKEGFEEGAKVRIQPEGGELTTFTLPAGEIDDSDSCVFAISGDVEEADSYTVYLDRYILGWYEDSDVRQDLGEKTYLEFHARGDQPDEWDKPA